MLSAVFDTSVLVSAFLSRSNPESVSAQLLDFARAGAVKLHLSPEIIAETLATLVESQRVRRRYRYSAASAADFCGGLLAATVIVVDPPPIPGAVPRDPEDDMVIACAVAAGVGHLVTRDRDLLSLCIYRDVSIVTPEQFAAIIRNRATE